MMPPNDAVELLQVFGDPARYTLPDGTISPRWELDILTTIRLPAPLPLSWIPPGRTDYPTVETVRCHKLVAPNLAGVFVAIQGEGLWESLKTFDGCYAWRRQRNSMKPSFHCWGLAIDLNSLEDPLGDPVIDMDSRIVAVFKRHGWRWGGNFKGNRVDGGHFEFSGFNW